MNKIVPLEIHGAFLVYGQRFLDQRGYFEELYNQTKFEKPITPYNWQQVSIAESKPNVLRGLHCSNYSKYVTCVQGEVYDVIVDLRPDSPTYLKWTGVWLNADDAANPVHLYVPKRCGHGYFCKRASLFVYLQDGTYNPKEDIEINLFDTTANVNWPKPIDSDSYIISEKDRNNYHLKQIPDLIKSKKLGDQYRDIVRLEDSGPEQVKWLVYGTSGFLGGHFVETVRKMPNHTFEFIRGSARLEDRRGLYEEINRHKPNRVVCMGGIAGKPDVLWCDRNQIETIRVNLIGQLNLLDVANQVGNIHCTILTTGGIYTYDEGEHKVGTGRPFTEDDPPNYNKLFYYETRIALEQLLKSYNNVLNLRIMYPTTHDIMNPRSLISKLIRYKEIKSIPISITVMDDLWPVLVDMIEKKTIGTFNFNNPGTISHDEILGLYKEHVDPEHTWSTAPFDSSRPAANLSAEKLLKFGYKVPNIKDSVKNIMISYKKKMDENRVKVE